MVRQAVDTLNRTQYQRGDQAYLELIGWEDVAPRMRARAQDVINTAIEDRGYDIYLGLMGDRLGTDTGVAESGTVEEYRRAVELSRANPGKIEVMFYFRQADQMITNESEAERVRLFQDEVRRDGFHQTYTMMRLQQDLVVHLGGIAQNWGVRQARSRLEVTDG